MGVFVSKPLADGQLPAVQSAIHTVPPFKTHYVKFFSLTNVSGSTVTCKIFQNVSGTPRQVGPDITLDPGQSQLVVDKDEAWALAAGNTIEAICSAATSVDFVISGSEET